MCCEEWCNMRESSKMTSSMGMENSKTLKRTLTTRDNSKRVGSKARVNLLSLTEQSTMVTLGIMKRMAGVFTPLKVRFTTDSFRIISSTEKVNSIMAMETYTLGISKMGKRMDRES